MKTWELRTVRQSGMFEKSKGDQDVNQYLQDQEEDDYYDDIEYETFAPSGEMTEALTAQLHFSATSSSPLMARPSCSTSNTMTSNETTMTYATNITSTHSHTKAQIQALSHSISKYLTKPQTHMYSESQTQKLPQVPYPIHHRPWGGERNAVLELYIAATGAAVMAGSTPNI